MKCIESLIIILFDFFQSDKDLAKSVLENKESLILKGIQLMDMISDYTIRVEKKRGESFEDLNRRVAANKIKKNNSLNLNFKLYQRVDLELIQGLKYDPLP